MGEQRIVIPYAPRAQFRAFHARRERWACLVCHRRAGKTVATINDLIRAALTCRREAPRFAYIAPLLSQAKDVAWEYLKSFALAIPGAEAHESELRVDFPNGARVRLYGADNPDRLRGIYLDGVVLDEYADMRPRLWAEIIRPALADRQGWAVFIGTPKGENEFYEIFDNSRTDPEWFSAIMRASETKILDEAELDDARKAMSPEQYEQEFECSFAAAIVGSYYGTLLDQAERQGRIGRVPYDPILPVITSWDLGLNDTTAIWFWQVVGRERRLIDHYETSGVGFDHYAKVVNDKQYSYGRHIFPHDVVVREMGSGGRSRVETLASLGLKAWVAPKTNWQERVNASRAILPLCWFDKERCKPGLASLRQYRREWDDRMRAFKPSPLHNFASNSADSFGYGAENVIEELPARAFPTQAESAGFYFQ